MAREKMVTRTITTTTIEFMALDVTAGTVDKQTATITGKITEPSKQLDFVRKIYETPTYKPAAIVSVSFDEDLYGMSEADFLAHAKLLPPRNVNGDANA